MTRRVLGLAAVAALVLVSFGSPSRAEVSAEVDSFSNYVRMLITADPSAGSSVWAVQKNKPSLRPLNPLGYTTGDLYPTVRESNEPARNPWAVWSRPAAGHYDLVFSRWDPAEDAWQPVALIQPWSTPGDDIGPALAFDIDYRPYLVWTRVEGGVSRVYLTLWLQSRWMAEYRVSDFDENAVASSVRLLADRRIEVRYDTASARVTRIVSFDRPRTITDEVTPFGRFRIDETYSAPSYPVFPH